MKVVFDPRAEAEHLEQIAYYEKQQSGLGARYLADVVIAIDLICAAPHRFPIVRKPALRWLGLKRFPFSILFRERDGVVAVVAIAPHRRRPGYWRDRI